jgi:hypothetical protein
LARLDVDGRHGTAIGSNDRPTHPVR